MKSILRHFLTVCLLWGLVCGYAQNNPTFSTSSFRELSTSDGLSDMLVNALFKDSQGYVWIGTGTSIDRFDGMHIKSFSFIGADEKLKRVQAIAETQDHHIWVGNGIGLWRVNPTANTVERMVGDRINTSVNALWCNGRDTLYMGTDQGLFIYAGGTIRHILLDENTLAAANRVHGIGQGEDDELWLTTDQGLFCYHVANGKANCYQPQLKEMAPDVMLKDVVVTPDCLYIGSMGQGILTFDRRTGRFDRYVDVGSKQISSLSGDGRQTLYVGTDGNGVHFIDTEKRIVTTSFQHRTGGMERLLRSNSVYSLLVDADGLIWVGYYQQGLDYTLYQDNLFTTYAFPPFFDSKELPVRSFCIHGGEKLIGSRDGLFYVDEVRRRFKEFRVPALRAGMVFSICPYDGEYYIGTFGGGLYVLNPETLQLRDFDPNRQFPFVNGHIFCMETDNKGRLWIGTSHGAFCYLHGKLVQHFTDSNSKLPEGNVYEIFFDSMHRGWFCTENGICLFEPSTGKMRTDVFPEGFVHREKIRVVYETSDHRLYFCPDKGAMFVSNLSMTAFRREAPGTPMEGHDGFFIQEDAAHNLWIGTNNGLFCYNDSLGYVPYTYADGIPSPVFTLCPPLYDEEGTLWLGNSKGLLYLDSHRLAEQGRYPYPLQVTDVLISGQSSDRFPLTGTPPANGLYLEASQNNLSFRFSDFSYTSVANTTFEYQLEGKDEGWIQANGISEVAYYGLSSGSYRFKVRKTGRPFTETSLNVHIESIWSLWIGWLLAVCSALLIGWVARRRWLKRHARFEVMADYMDDGESDERTFALQAEKYRTLHLSDEESRRLVHRLEQLMRKRKPYMDRELKIAGLAEMLGVSAHTLSYLLSQHLQRSYYDFINDYRVEEFKRIIKNEGQGRYTLSALAEKCGFSSRASFFRYFKKATGITPNEYIHQLEEGKEM